jgi:hypothetical protein
MVQALVDAITDCGTHDGVQPTMPITARCQVVLQDDLCMARVTRQQLPPLLTQLAHRLLQQIHADQRSAQKGIKVGSGNHWWHPSYSPSHVQVFADLEQPDVLLDIPLPGTPGLQGRAALLHHHITLLQHQQQPDVEAFGSTALQALQLLLQATDALVLQGYNLDGEVYLQAATEGNDGSCRNPVTQLVRSLGWSNSSMQLSNSLEAAVRLGSSRSRLYTQTVSMPLLMIMAADAKAQPTGQDWYAGPLLQAALDAGPGSVEQDHVLGFLCSLLKAYELQLGAEAAWIEGLGPSGLVNMQTGTATVHPDKVADLRRLLAGRQWVAPVLLQMLTSAQGLQQHSGDPQTTSSGLSTRDSTSSCQGAHQGGKAVLLPCLSLFGRIAADAPAACPV